LITFIGIAQAVQSWAALLALLGFFAISFGYRIRVEEKALLSELGDNYANYMKRTKRLIPFLI
jgi:protein-S-isoprenylcysteine O-methyltransferase Ste14